MSAAASVCPPTQGTSAAALVSAVAYWQLVQQTRIKLQLPIQRVAKEGVLVPEKLLATLGAVDEAEQEAAKLILAAWKDHPLRDWAEDVKGLGAHSCAIVVGLLGGDVLIARPRRRDDKTNEWVDGEPYRRTLSQLRSYCGVGAQRRRVKGMSQEETLALGKPLLKARLRLISESFMTAYNGAGLPAGNKRYRTVYDSAKAQYANKIHETPCRGRGRCGLDAGEPWRDGHKHAAALRLVAKTFLADLFAAAEQAEA